MEDFPSNSKRPAVRREAPKAEVEKRVSPVVQGEVVRRKRPLGKRIREAFIGDDDRTVLEFLIQDVIMPNVRDMVFEAGQSGLERSLYGTSRPFRRGIGSGGDPRGHRNYNGISRGDGRSMARPADERQLSRRARSTHDFGEIVIERRSEAEAVLEGMYAILDEYGIVTVSDLYQLADIPSQFTDRKWGWNDLLGTTIQRVREGYLIDLPRPEVIN